MHPSFSKSERFFLTGFLAVSLLLTGVFYIKKTSFDSREKSLIIEAPYAVININSASLNDLESLPGIGPILAEDIVLYRQKNGDFKIPGDLKNVKGIGDRKFEQIKDLISTSE